MVGWSPAACTGPPGLPAEWGELLRVGGQVDKSSAGFRFFAFLDGLVNNSDTPP